MSGIKYIHKQILIPLLATLLALFQIFLVPDPDFGSHELNIDQTDSVRVSLYGLDQPDTVRITNNTASATYFSDGESVTIPEKEIDGTLILKNRQLLFQLAGSEFLIDSLKVASSSASTRLISNEHGYRHYNGSILIKPHPVSPGLFIINTVDLESYIASVVGSEMDFEHPEALKAQSVVSRTYALWSVKKSPYSEFDLRDHEASQVYFGNIPDKPRYRRASEATRGEILTWSDQLILAVFSSTCGGQTVNNQSVWGGIDHPYLTSQSDAGACSISPHFKWSYSISESRFKTFVSDYYGFNVEKKEIETGPSGRVKTVTLTDRNADNISFTGNEFRLFINQNAGPLALRSTKYDWDVQNDTLRFEGYGLGHGVGLCQWGALGFAESGWTYKDILSFYFSGTKVVNLNTMENDTITLFN